MALSDTRKLLILRSAGGAYMAVLGFEIPFFSNLLGKKIVSSSGRKHPTIPLTEWSQSRQGICALEGVIDSALLLPRRAGT